MPSNFDKDFSDALIISVTFKKVRAREDKRPTKVHNILLYANTGGKRRKGVRAQKVALSNIDITGGFKNR